MQNLISWYRLQTSTAKLNFDQAQLLLLEELNLFLENFAKATTSRLFGGLRLPGLNFITRRREQPHKLGYYIYGDVGRGKSMIMNIMYEFTAGERKTRLHFHEFMHNIHQQMASLSVDDPLKHIAHKLKESYDILYLDEMHVSDIATAMILKRLFESLFANNIYIVTSSNFKPDDLWPNGLMRERFLPAIGVLKHYLTVASLNSEQDYRMLHNSFNKLFIIQKNDAQEQLTQIFQAINGANGPILPNYLSICGRTISCIRQGSQIIWFDFNTICGAMRSQLDYLELVKQFRWFIISDIFMLTADKKDLARRFTWLIDILYDSGRKLALSSTVLIEDIYCHGDFSNEFQRTISRLEEMQTEEYLQKNLTVKA